MPLGVFRPRFDGFWGMVDNDMADIFADMIPYVAEKVLGSKIINIGDIEVDLSKGFTRKSIVDLVKEYAGIDLLEAQTLDEAKAALDAIGLKCEVSHTYIDSISPNVVVEQSVAANSTLESGSSINLIVNSAEVPFYPAPEVP